MRNLHILHMLSTTKHVSPFDVNMAVDAGFDIVIPYGNVDQWDITGLTQDAMFSRSPEDAKRTGGFIGGKNAILSLEMMDTARETMFAPFQFSLFADPAGSFTTAGAMVACANKVLKSRSIGSLKGLRVVVYGATGVVGFASGVIAGLEGADVVLVGYDGIERVQKAAAAAQKRFGCELGFADGDSDQKNADIAREADVIFSAGPAGRQILSKENLSQNSHLKVATDVNAVAPAGIEGVGTHDNGVPIEGTHHAHGIGALAIGDIKYKTQAGLFRRMIEENGPLFLDFRDAYEIAKRLVA